MEASLYMQVLFLSYYYSLYLDSHQARHSWWTRFSFNSLGCDAQFSSLPLPHIENMIINQTGTTSNRLIDRSARTVSKNLTEWMCKPKENLHLWFVVQPLKQIIVHVYASPLSSKWPSTWSWCAHKACGRKQNQGSRSSSWENKVRRKSG